MPFPWSRPGHEGDTLIGPPLSPHEFEREKRTYAQQFPQSLSRDQKIERLAKDAFLAYAEGGRSPTKEDVRRVVWAARWLYEFLDQPGPEPVDEGDIPFK